MKFALDSIKELRNLYILVIKQAKHLLFFFPVTVSNDPYLKMFSHMWAKLRPIVELVLLKASFVLISDTVIFIFILNISYQKYLPWFCDQECQIFHWNLCGTVQMFSCAKNLLLWPRKAGAFFCHNSERN